MMEENVRATFTIVATMLGVLSVMLVLQMMRTRYLEEQVSMLVTCATAQSTLNEHQGQFDDLVIQKFKEVQSK